MINSNIEDAKTRLGNMGLEEKIIEKLLIYKDGEDFLFDSAFKITELSGGDFTEKVKDQLTEGQAQEVYQKALARKYFVCQYMAHSQSASEPHYKALRCSQKA